MHLFSLVFTMVLNSAPAATLIECVDPHDGGTPILRLLVTKRATGAPGEGWQMIHRGLLNGAPAGAANQRTVSAKTSRTGEVEITIIFGQTPTGPVGQTLRISGEKKHPALTEINIGGFTGPLTTGRFRCVRTPRYCGTLLGDL